MISLERRVEQIGLVDSEGASALPRAMLRFPCHSFKDCGEYQQFRKSAETLIDNRRLYEQSLASPADSISIEGTCGVCLRPARFVAQTAYGEVVSGGRLPDWREGLACDCEHRLISRERAVLHFLRSVEGLQPWMRLLAFGSIGSLATPLAAETSEIVSMPQIPLDTRSSGYHLPVADGSCHIAVSLDTLQLVPSLQAAIAAVARALAPGGRFVFTVPFHADNVKTTSAMAARPAAMAMATTEWPDTVHRIGWDVLDMLRDAGFVDSTAFLYWAEELGYMGPHNFIFSASK